jgi:hypothetical protein
LLSQVLVERIAPAGKGRAVMLRRKRLYAELNCPREEAINFLCALAARAIAGGKVKKRNFFRFRKASLKITLLSGAAKLASRLAVSSDHKDVSYAALPEASFHSPAAMASMCVDVPLHRADGLHIAASMVVPVGIDPRLKLIALYQLREEADPEQLFAVHRPGRLLHPELQRASSCSRLLATTSVALCSSSSGTRSSARCPLASSSVRGPAPYITVGMPASL